MPVARAPKGYAPLKGSERRPTSTAKLLGPADPDESMSVTIVLRRRSDGSPVPDFAYYATTPPSARRRLSTDEFAARYGAADEDIATVEKFVTSRGLTVVESHPARRAIRAAGTVAQMSAAFGVELQRYEHTVTRRSYEGQQTEEYRGRDGVVYVPKELAEIIIGVFGLDNRRISRSGTGDPPNTKFLTVPEVRGLYNFPTNSAAGQTIAVFSETGYQQADLDSYFATLPPGYPAVTPTDITVDASNDGTEDLENTQDICIAATAAPGADIAVYFTTYTQQGWIDLFHRVLHPDTGDPDCSVLTSSFYVSNGDDPTSLDYPVTEAWITAVDMSLQDAAIQGLTVCICTGDQGSDCQQGTDTTAFVTFPASDPWALAVGGTTIGDVVGSSFDEYVWNDTFNITGFYPSGATGGGVSAFFAKPSYQNGAGVPPSINPGGFVGRGLPDVAANASPNSGYPLNLADAAAQGLQNPVPMSGTSASTPLWAGLIAVMNASMGDNLGFINAVLYEIAPAGFRDILGAPGPASNAFNGAPGYPAGPGWDACTGWGSPDGEALLSALMATWSAPSLEFWVTKSTFGVDEVTDTKGWPDSFAIVLDGFAPFQLPTTPTINFSGAFTTVPGVTITPNSAGARWQDPSLTYTQQRLEIPFDITFTTGSLPAFPAAGGEFEELLIATATPVDQELTNDTLIDLVGGADPYFTSIAPGGDNPFWLSQDLRVFSATPGVSDTPISGVGTPPTFTTADPTAFDPTAAFTYAQALIGYLNGNYADPIGIDPFVSVVPEQSGALSGDSSVTPTSPNRGGAAFQNYNFAIARVRLRGGSGDTAENVRVFFRLFLTQSNDTDYQPSATYLSMADTAGNPGVPEVGAGTTTIPFFATGTLDTQIDYETGGANNQVIQITSGDATWAYFACFLDVYDPDYTVGGQPVQNYLAGTHHCLVAEIAYDDAPIVNSGGITMSPENSDKLAQRNLQVTTSDNPGPASAHLVPQTFDLRPSKSTVTTPGTSGQGPDELMIDWGKTPVGSVATIYWPAVSAAQVIALADGLYAVHGLRAADGNTIATTVTAGICYIPIPGGTGENLAGLFSVQLPGTVTIGQEFDIVVRRVATRVLKPLDDYAQQAVADAATTGQRRGTSRYVVGTFQVTIPVSTARVLLAPEENTLAILKWRLQQLSQADRWYPVMLRYVSYVAGRVRGLGGNAASIPASPTGYWPVHVPPPKQPGDDHCEVGKVSGVEYDRFGDFSGFRLLTESGHRHLYRASAAEIESLIRFAWRDRIVVEVCASHNHPAEPVRILLLR
jgi:hypothetical protein